MSKFKVGERVKIIKECSTCDDWSVGTVARIIKTDNSQMPYRLETDSGEIHWFEENSVVRTILTLETLQIGDKVTNGDDTLIVNGRLGDVLFMLDEDGHYYSGTTIKELRDNDFTPVQPEPQDDTVEMTLEEVAKLKGVPVEKLRIKD